MKACDAQRWNLLLIAHDLPRSPNVKNAFLFKYFAHLDLEVDSVNRACIVGLPEPVDLNNIDPPPARIHVPSLSPSLAEQAQIVTELGSLLPRAAHLPELDPVDSPSLREQIRSLADSRNLEEGTMVLRRLLRDLFKCDGARLGRLGQGLSGAKVFRVQLKRDGRPPREVILKLSSGGDFWKILLELERHAEAKDTLGIDDYLIHYPRLAEAEYPFEYQDRLLTNVVYYKNWYAISYDFLGGEKFGTLIDLETVVVEQATVLEEKVRDTEFGFAASEPSTVVARRLELFSLTLDWLCRKWYMKEGLLTREQRGVWNTEDTPAKQYPAMPPYQLAGKSKGLILSFLDGHASEIGERFFDNWEENRKRVWELVEKTAGATGVAYLDRQASFLLSPAHGDLNGNNLLLWLDESCHPFLIDFPFYQKQGHALQDFARLEVEIKFALMDRQADSPVLALPALDHTSSQLLLWREMENHLLSDAWHDSKSAWAAGGFSDNVDFCLKLVQLLRSKAAEVQRQKPAPHAESFMDEYRPALLYHTVRASGYSALSLFKRLLAVYSAGRLLAA